jgi:hypothetical protein
MSKLVNNWEAAGELQQFKGMYIDPLVKKYENLRDSLEILKKKGGDCDHQKRMVDRLEGQMINFHRLHSSMLNLIGQHEELVDKLSEMYAKWYHDISMEGVQPHEMMGIQAEMLEQIFKDLNSILNPQ